MTIFSKHKKAVYALLGVLLLTTACELDPVTDPNNPSVASVSTDASKAELQVLVYGLEARHRGYYGPATQFFGVLGREVWAYFGSDPRFFTHWLGTGITETYPDFFGSIGTYTTPYLAVKHANVLIQAAENSTKLTSEEANAYIGLGKSIKAFQLSWPLLQQWDNGIRVDVEDPLNPGPTLGREEAWAAIRDILDEGYDALTKSGASLPFETLGLPGTNDGLARLNRAMAARFALYDEDWQGALDALALSYMDLDVTADSRAKLLVGPVHLFGNAPDVANPLYYPYDRPTNTILIAHPALLEDALPGDERVAAKFIKRVENPLSNPNLVDANGDRLLGEYQDNRWPENISPIPYLRNEELILIYAEANARLNRTDEAVQAINVIRNAWGLPDYSGATDTEALVEEILFQRRYSLWSEAGHRWVDLRRTGRLNENYVDLRDGGRIFSQIERRTSEINWDNR